MSQGWVCPLGHCMYILNTADFRVMEKSPLHLQALQLLIDQSNTSVFLTRINKKFLFCTTWGRVCYSSNNAEDVARGKDLPERSIKAHRTDCIDGLLLALDGMCRKKARNVLKPCCARALGETTRFPWMIWSLKRCLSLFRKRCDYSLLEKRWLFSTAVMRWKT